MPVMYEKETDGVTMMEAAIKLVAKGKGDACIADDLS